MIKRPNNRTAHGINPTKKKKHQMQVPCKPLWHGLIKNSLIVGKYQISPVNAKALHDSTVPNMKATDTPQTIMSC